MFCLRNLVTNNPLRLTWEHEGWGWYDADEVITNPSLNGVSKLAESLRRVYFEADFGPQAAGVLAGGLTKLATDHESGARELATMAVKTLHDVAASLEILDWNLIRRLASLQKWAAKHGSNHNKRSPGQIIREQSLI